MSPGGLLLAVKKKNNKKTKLAGMRGFLKLANMNDEDVMNKLAFAWFICLKKQRKTAPIILSDGGPPSSIYRDKINRRKLVSPPPTKGLLSTL